MDWNSLKNTVSNLTLYDLKAGVRQVQNAVMNYTEMEAKVREATNNEPWGASSTLMQEISNGTYNYQLLNEIMPMIYHRFTEKSADQWRQIYKALQLLEFLIKNGSERVIDDARSHVSLLKILKQFHFIDANGKDQGMNVRNRSKELTELLTDVERIRSERKKARANRQKYSGFQGGSSGIGGSGSSGRYGGFGSENSHMGSGGFGSYGSYDGRVYGDGGGFGGDETEYRETQAHRDTFEEYDENEDGAGASSSRRRPTSTIKAPPKARKETHKPEPTKAKEPEVDLFDFGDEPTTKPVTAQASLSAPAPTLAGDDDADFDDFQSAQPSNGPVSISATPAKPSQSYSLQPAAGTQLSNSTDLFGSLASAPRLDVSNDAANTMLSSHAYPNSTGPQSMGARQDVFQPSQPNYFTSVSANNSIPNLQTRGTVSITPGGLGKPIGSSSVAQKSSGDAFAGLLGNIGTKKNSVDSTAKQPMASMARQKASAGIWGAGSVVEPAASVSQPAVQQPQQKQKLGGGLDDLLG